ncbi:hypothetical protein [Campylobacter curvus]|uniref:hypothetical protein n=1 Tax=Campylobacter curvus TaxID=200 RepID=UPI00146FDD6C|nr:hypothetical protein [Campylobacter curvus]
MKLTFNGSLAIIRPFGFLEGNFLGKHPSKKDIELIEARNTTCVLLSLKDVTFFSPLWLASMIGKLVEISKQTGARIGICDYDEGFFELMMKTSSKIINFSLFETEDIASLFFNKIAMNADEKIVVFNENEEYRAFIAQRLAQRGYKPRVAGHLREFLRVSKNRPYAISARTHLVSPRKFIQSFVKDDVVIYRIEGIMDSDFVEEFDVEYHQNMLKIGFKFFIFWVNITSALNIRGGEFLIKLSQSSSQFGALLGICGLNQNNTSIDLVNRLKSANMLLYKSLQEFFDDDSTVYLKKRIFEIAPSHITKNIVEILPFIISSTIDTLLPLTNAQIVCADTKVQTYDVSNENDFVRACVLFYGDFEMRFILGLKKDKAEKICKILAPKDLENGYLSGYSQAFSIIVNKILSSLLQKEPGVKVTMPKILINERFFDRVSKGALAKLHVKDEEFGMIFVSK